MIRQIFDSIPQKAKACADKKGQAVMEYAIIFFIAGLGMAATFSMLQSQINVSLYYQAEKLIWAGTKLL